MRGEPEGAEVLQVFVEELQLGRAVLAFGHVKEAIADGGEVGVGAWTVATVVRVEHALVAVDEFTSVVDRNVAKVGSAAVSKAIRKGSIRRKFVAVTCHYDVADWLEPDWVVDMATQTLARGRLQRPKIQIELFPCRREAWRVFSRHHYLDTACPPTADTYIASWEGEAVAFVAVMPLVGFPGRRRISRIVVLPDYQGIGIGRAVLDATCRMLKGRGHRVNITSSHPAMIASLKRDSAWRCVNYSKTGYRCDGGEKALNGKGIKRSGGRPVASFEFLG